MNGQVEFKAEGQGDGGPAFPTDSAAQVGSNTWHFAGMSLRDYFAAKAAQGFVAAGQMSHEGDIARRAFEIADAMLKARSA